MTHNHLGTTPYWGGCGGTANHTHICIHFLQYCATCDVVYCASCQREWTSKPIAYVTSGTYVPSTAGDITLT